MLFIRMLGDQDHEESRHGPIIWRTERYRKLRAHEQHHRVSDPGDTGMWNRDAASQCSGSALLPSPERSENQFAIDMGPTAGEASDLFARLLRVSRRYTQHDVFAGEKTTDDVHKSLIFGSGPFFAV